MTERDGQVDPQPRARPVRPSLQPLRGARITDFVRDGNRSELTYEEAGKPQKIIYTVNADSSVTFQFADGRTGIFRHREGPDGQRPPRRPPAGE